MKDSIFLCYANNSLGSLNYTVKVLIEKPPDSHNLSSKSRLNIGGNFSLKCEIDGLPKPNISWYRNRNLLTFGNQTTNEHNGTLSRHININDKYLHVTDASVQDFGIYVCIGENYLGKTEQSFDVIFNSYWSEWSEWSECSRACGQGFTERHRFCNQMQPHQEQNQNTCIGEHSEKKECLIKSCGWSEWSHCSRSCGNGQMYRYKGNRIEIVKCNRGPCTDKYHNRIHFTPLLTYESSRDNNEVKQNRKRPKPNKSHRKTQKHLVIRRN